MNQKLEIFNKAKLAEIAGIPYNTLISKFERSDKKFKAKYTEGANEAIRKVSESRDYVKKLIAIEQDPEWIKGLEKMIRSIDSATKEFKKLIAEEEDGN